jgi:hypothetical protein
MYKRALSLMLVSFLIQMICIAPVSAFAPTNTETERVARMKERIGAAQLEKKRVVITRRDGTKLNEQPCPIKMSLLNVGVARGSFACVKLAVRFNMVFTC